MLKGFVIVVTALCTLFIACSDSNPVGPIAVQGSGVLETEPRDVGIFHSIVFSDVGEVNIGQTDSAGCWITVDDNVMELIVTRVEDGILYIESKAGYNLEEYDLTVDLSINTLESVTLVGVGRLATQGQIQVDQIVFVVGGVGLVDFDLDANSVVSTMTGVASIALSGSTATHEIVSSGIGNVNAFDLVTGSTTAILTGVGNAEVYATSSLNATISGLGSVSYKGSPTINATITGTGRLINAN